MSFLQFVILLGLLCSLSHAQNHVIYNGWRLRPSENHNHWAERHRFQTNDEIVFKYKKGDDSVLVVGEDDYNKCKKSNPIKTLDDGESVFRFDRSGPFFFISGHDHNCEQGQKMIIVVIADRHPVIKPPTPPPSHSPSPSPTVHPPSHHSPSPSPSSAKPPTPAAPVQPPSPSHSPTAITPTHSPPLNPPSPSPSPSTHTWPVQPPSHSPSPAVTPTPPPSPSPKAETPTQAPPTNSPSPSPLAHAPPAQPPSPPPSPPPSAPLDSPPPKEPQPDAYPPVYLPPNHAPAPAPSSASALGGSFILTVGLCVVAIAISSAVIV